MWFVRTLLVCENRNGVEFYLRKSRLSTLWCNQIVCLACRNYDFVVGRRWVYSFVAAPWAGNSSNLRSRFVALEILHRRVSTVTRLLNYFVVSRLVVCYLSCDISTHVTIPCCCRSHNALSCDKLLYWKEGTRFLPSLAEQSVATWDYVDATVQVSASNHTGFCRIATLLKACSTATRLCVIMCLSVCAKWHLVHNHTTTASEMLCHLGWAGVSLSK